jgi:hypothetical protein
MGRQKQSKRLNAFIHKVGETFEVPSDKIANMLQLVHDYEEGKDDALAQLQKQIRKVAAKKKEFKAGDLYQTEMVYLEEIMQKRNVQVLPKKKKATKSASPKSASPKSASPKSASPKSASPKSASAIVEESVSVKSFVTAKSSQSSSSQQDLTLEEVRELFKRLRASAKKAEHPEAVEDLNTLQKKIVKRVVQAGDLTALASAHKKLMKIAKKYKMRHSNTYKEVMERFESLLDKASVSYKLKSRSPQLPVSPIRKKCAEGQYRNPKTNRCKKKKECPEGKRFNKMTGRCKKVSK